MVKFRNRVIKGDTLVISKVINLGTGPELVVRACDGLGFKWGWHGIGAKCSIRRSYLDQVSGGEGEDSAAAPTLE